MKSKLDMQEEQNQKQPPGLVFAFGTLVAEVPHARAGSAAILGEAHVLRDDSAGAHQTLLSGQGTVDPALSAFEICAGVQEIRLIYLGTSSFLVHTYAAGDQFISRSTTIVLP